MLSLNACIYIYAVVLSQVIPVFPYIPSLWMAAVPSSFSFAALVEEYCCYARGKCLLNGYDIDVGMTYQWGMVSIKHGASNIPSAVHREYLSPVVRSSTSLGPPFVASTVSRAAAVCSALC